MQTIEQPKPITVIGIELRTSNENAFQTIQPFWQRFYQEGILGQIPNKTSKDVLAVYTNFENEGKNNNGIYSLIIGAEVKNLDTVPSGFVAATIPTSKRAVFEVETGHPEKVSEKWIEIWRNTDLKKTFIADYERYSESGDIGIYVGIE